MEHRDERRKLGFWSCAGISIGGLLLLISFITIWFFTPFGKPKPTIQIIQPDESMFIESGDGIVLIIGGQSRNGFDEFYLLVNDQFYDLYKVSDPQQRSLEVNFTWFSSQPGIHKLSVIGRNNADIESEPASLLVVVNPRDLYQTTQEALDEDLADSDESLNQVAEDDVADEADDQANIEENPSIGVDSETDQANLDENLDSIDLNGEFPFELPDQPGDNIPVIEQFTIQDEQNASGAFVSYHISASDDLGIAFIFFYLSNLDDPLSPEITQITCGNQVNCHIEDGIQLGQGGWGLSVQAVDTIGQVSELHSREVHILAGEDPRSVAIGFLQNILSSAIFQINPFIQDVHIDLINTVDDIGLPEILRYECSGHSVVLKMSYTYLSDHGDAVYIGATAEKGSEVIAAGHTQINPGSGEAEIKMELISPEISNQTSDQLQLYLRVGENYFYEEVAELDIAWPKPLPDLIISATKQEEAVLTVNIKNNGCASIDEMTLRINLADDQIYEKIIGTKINPGQEFVWTDFINPNLFSMGFKATIDPDGAIDEINETNNSFKLNPISIKYIEFYKIDIHNDKDGSARGAGDIFLSGRIDDIHFRRPSGEDWVWELSEGSYPIGGILESMIFYPEPFSNDYVYIFIRGEEDDDWREEWMGDIHYSHSPDFFDETSWKRGGDFYATSGKEDFSLYWRIVLNERN